MAITKDDILNQLRRIKDPELQRDIVSLNMIHHVAYCDGYASVELAATRALPQPVQARLQQLIEKEVRSLGDDIRQVNISFPPEAPPGNPGSAAGSTPSGNASPAKASSAATPQQPTGQDQARASNPLPNVKHMIAVGAGKGGVGKSTIAVNLAVGLARRGLSVGLLDGDIYGPSTPTMLGLHGKQPRGHGQTVYPFEVHGIKTMTIGALVEEGKALIWRGPMAHGAFRQLATQTDWGALDYLIIDLPPGTGDVPLTMSQLLPLAGAVVVCTPQLVAQDDAIRAVAMFQQLSIPVLGVVENMSYFIGDDGKEYDIFGKGGAQMMAGEAGVPFLGTVPINTALRINSDAGDPTANFTAEGSLADELNRFVDALLEQVQQADAAGEVNAPTLEIR